MSRISKVTVFLREVLIPAEVQVVSLLNAYRLLAGRPAVPTALLVFQAASIIQLLIGTLSVNRGEVSLLGVDDVQEGRRNGPGFMSGALR